MPGGDLMDVLVAEAKIIKHPVPSKSGMRSGVLAPKVKMWQVGARRKRRRGDGRPPRLQRGRRL
jgi:hypothetical protein